SILTAHRDTLVATAKTLLEAETLSADDLPTIAPWDEVA
ncbi:MAG: peptidase M41, partial [Rhodospirillaceae bacterium]|nr:peptidase M41 [Rhodospirillaceae bacterium]